MNSFVNNDCFGKIEKVIQSIKDAHPDTFTAYVKMNPEIYNEFVTKMAKINHSNSVLGVMGQTWESLTRTEQVEWENDVRDVIWRNANYDSKSIKSS